MTRIAVFAYASLVDRASAARTLGREVAPVPGVRLRGWRRRWSQVRDNLRTEKTFAVEPGGRLPQWVLGLNVEPDADGDRDQAPNGVLIEVTEAELARLDLREIRYDRIEVTEGIIAAEGFDVVVAYTAKPGHHAPEPPPGAVVIARYARAVEEAFATLGGGEREAYLRTTGAPPVELVEGVLVRDRIPPGNPRGW